MEQHKVKTNLIFPRDLLVAIDRLVGTRKRTRFIVEATREKLTNLRFAKILDGAAGIWSDEEHPDLNTQGDINRYLRDARRNTSRRMGAKRS